ncbi:inositol monophosphatase [Halovenus sp. WSH3]|uniref:fructose-bisphosphatase n=1 Tax=Halovenus carboxidivorans TaxID=2692199 RepID=A0A6B0T805_9EURY|nr:inositol monophosphatase [Halovenus carboxidivorans]MXR51030.1 inositol monophosphatase [Halovenus carboxidivorans]
MSEATHRAAVAERAARAGGVVAREAFRGDLTVESKSSPTDVVSNADREAQQQVLATIAQEFPGATVVCEEDVPPVGVGDIEVAETVPEAGPAWVVDPIDGTANFVREIRFWASSVAAVVDGDPVAGATAMPAMEDVYTAGPESVSRNDEPMSVSDRTDPAEFAIGTTGRWSTSDPEGPSAIVREVLERFGDIRRFGSIQGLLALVAAGGMDGAIMPDPPNAWDSLAGVHLVRRAGGRATTLSGARFTDGDDSLIVSNDTRHDTVLEAARAALSE